MILVRKKIELNAEKESGTRIFEKKSKISER
jgi:hypothetical protein